MTHDRQDRVALLLTISHKDESLRYAIKIDRATLGGDAFTLPMKPEDMEAIHNILPERIKSYGSVVDVEQIFGVCLF